MSRTLKRAGILIFAVILVFALVACGPSKGSAGQTILIGGALCLTGI